MKNINSSIWLGVAGLIAFLAGCGKSDNTSPPPKETEPVQKVSESRPTEAAKPQTPNPTPLAAVDGGKKPQADRAATLAGNPPPTVDVNAPKAAVAPIPSPASAPNASSTTAPIQANQSAPTLTSLSQDQVVRGLQEALAKGLQQAITRLGHDGGFLTNLQVKIPMPEKLQKVESALRAVKQDKLADDFVATMNHAAEQAVPVAGGVFGDALKGMSIDDAKSILAGPNDAATQYFQRTTQTNLYGKFYPIVQQATQKAGVTAAYKNLMAKADVANLGAVTEKLGNLGSVLGGSVLDKDSLDIDAYVTNKAMDGLFKIVADEEKRIRANPVARTTDLLQKVFGALKN
jgi:hypothetical protein